ncbi:uncharacterized protein E0L32_011073 [Thyridium curvatum]|uniref:Deacetylase sirtuin-type domain-containing protein n=1 Tax=Thyridium curvatum TaxID=1093900 RepID=A0A507ADC8_9PEZI|nr:uncharacterized protein E0L32_011073 [Thyridium curvatum]TPX07005.1 hypothetical protein E0L32_011073 [Thyridium curvatum]
MSSDHSSPPSSPLSVLSKSPSLPSSPASLDPSKRYPSPTASSQSGGASPMKLQDEPDEICVRTDGPPPSKKRRVNPRKPRTTEYVQLEEASEDDEEKLEALLKALRKKKKIVVIAGAGISVSAGIPDFRSSTGLFTSLRGQHGLKKGSGKHLFDASVYKHDDATESFHSMVRELAQMAQNAKPTPFHHLLASLAHEGRLMRLYTQNVDCIDTSMPPLATNIPLNRKGPWPVTIQLHGGLSKMACSKCGGTEAFDASLFEGPEAPLCEPCTVADAVRTEFAGKRSHGIGRLRPRIVLYNEFNPDEEAIGQVMQADLKRGPDAVIVVGTTLKIPGVRRIVKEMCLSTRSRNNGFTAWVNIDPEPQGAEFKGCWDLIVKGKSDDVAELVNLPHWDEQDIGDSWKVTGIPEAEERCKEGITREHIDIVLDAKPPSETTEPAVKEETPELPELKSKLVEQVQGIPTPSASPKLRTALPDHAAANKSKQKQGKLLFGSQTKPEAAGKQTKARKPRQPKKAKEEKPRSNLVKAFKATKNVLPGAGSHSDINKQKKHSLPWEPESSDLSSPPPAKREEGETFSGLPPLRDNYYKENHPPFTIEAAPSTPPQQQGHFSPSGRETISPSSKPRSLSHLID